MNELKHYFRSHSFPHELPLEVIDIITDYEKHFGSTVLSTVYIIFRNQDHWKGWSTSRILNRIQKRILTYLETHTNAANSMPIL